MERSHVKVCAVAWFHVMGTRAGMAHPTTRCLETGPSNLGSRKVCLFINQDGLDMKNNTENRWLLSNSRSSVFTEGLIWLISRMLLLL